MKMLELRQLHIGSVLGPEFGQIYVLISARIRENVCVDIGPNSVIDIYKGLVHLVQVTTIFQFLDVEKSSALSLPFILGEVAEEDL